MPHILDPNFGADIGDDLLMGDDVEISVEIDPRTNRHHKVVRPKPQHRLPIAPPGFRTLMPSTRLDLRNAYSSVQGRAAGQSYIRELLTHKPRFQGDSEFGADDFGALEEVGAEMEEIGADLPVVVQQGQDLGPIYGRLSQIEGALNSLRGLDAQLGGRVSTLWNKHQRLMARIRRLSTNIPLSDMQTQRSLGIDYRPTSAGSDMEIAAVENITGETYITATVGTDLELTWTPSKGTVQQFASWTYVQHSSSAAATVLFITDATLNGVEGIFNKMTAPGIAASRFADADIGKHPGLRINPKITPGQDEINLTVRARGAAASTVTFSLYGVLSSLEDSGLGYRQKPRAR